MNRSRSKLDEYQRWMIVILNSEMGVTPDVLRYHPKLLKADGQPLPKKQIQTVIERYQGTGSVNERKRSGRPRILSKRQEYQLIHYVKSHRKMSYRNVLYRKKYQMHRRTLNDYTLRNKISKNPSLIVFLWFFVQHSSKRSSENFFFVLFKLSNFFLIIFLSKFDQIVLN